MKSLILWVLMASSVSAGSQKAEFDFPQGKLSLVQSKETLGLYFQLNPEWHIYWKNSGDSGAPPIWKWNLEGAQFQKELWPVPERIPVAGLVNIGYSNQSLFLFRLQAEAEFKAEVDLEFLICKVECIPYFTKLGGFFVKSKVDSDFEALQQNFTYAELPPDLDVRLEIFQKTPTELVAQLSLPTKVKNLEIFPENGQSFQSSQPKLDPEVGFTKVSFALQANSQENLLGSVFLVKADERAFEIKLSKPEVSLFTILFWAILGGLILNLMPCVLPVLSIKVLSFVQSPGNLKAAGWLYTLGVLVSFLVIGAILLMLRAAGEQIGWGFQLQSPKVAAALAVLFLWVGFNFLGLFEVGQSAAGLGSGRKTGAFLTGVLATLVATPCTAPFMGAALGASLTLPASQTMLVFFSLGFGMSLPFLILAYLPGALRILPRPGNWMVNLKEFLSFPMFATVIWLLWVLSQQVGNEVVFIFLMIVLFVGFWLWMTKKWRDEEIQQRLLVVGFLVSMALAIFSCADQKSQGVQSSSTLWQKYEPLAVEADLKNNEAVFIDFTAAWCITCQVNKKSVLQTDEIEKLFQQQRVSLYVADWTYRDPIITQALADFGRNSLPLYVFYQSGSRQANVLPEILTQSMILKLFKNQQEVRSE